MAIDSISFGKSLFKRSEKKENKKEVQIPEDFTSQSTPLNKIRKQVISSYLAAMMAAGSLAVGTTSCVDNDVVVNVDTENLESRLQQLIDIQNKSMEFQQKIMEYLLNNNTQNEEMIELMKQIMNQNKEISSILMGIGSDVASLNAAVTKISALIEASNANDTELLAKIDQIIQNGENDSQKLDELIKLNIEQNNWLGNISKLISSLEGSNNELADLFLQFYNDYKEGEKTHTEFMNNIYQALLENNEISESTLEEIKKLSTDSAKLDKIIELLESIDSKIGNLVDEVKDLGDNFTSQSGEKLADILQKFLDQFQDHSITSNALAAEILEELKKSNINDASIQNKLDVIIEQMKNQEITDKEALDKIAELLAQMNEKMTTIIDKLSGLSEQVNEFMVKNDQNHLETIEMMKDIINNFDDIKANQEKSLEYSSQILQKLDESVAQLEQINTKTITIDQLKESFGPYFDQIVDKIGDIQNGQIDVDTIKEIVADLKPDLTLTNALLETINTTIQNKNFDGNSQQLAALNNLVGEVLAEIRNGNMTTAEGYEKILEKLASMEGMLDAIQKTGEEINTKFEEFTQEAASYGTKWTSQLQQIIDGQLDKTTFQAYTTMFTEAMEKAETAQQERFLVIKAAIENINPGGAVDIDELISKLPDYSNLLTEIKNEIGNQVTKDDLDKYGKEHTIDLTLTNAMLETINTTIQNKNFVVTDSSAAAIAEVKEVLQEINKNLTNTAISAADRLPSKDQVEQLLDALKKIVDNTTTPEEPETRSYAQLEKSRRNVMHNLNELNRMLAQAQNKKATYIAPEFNYTKVFNA